MAFIKLGCLIIAALAAVVAAMPPDSPAPAAIKDEDLIQEESQTFAQAQQFVDPQQRNQLSNSREISEFPNQRDVNLDQRFSSQQGGNPAQPEFRPDVSADQRQFRDQSFSSEQQGQFQNQNYRQGNFGQNPAQEFSQNQQFNQQQESFPGFQGQQVNPNLGAESFGPDSFQNQRGQNQFSEPLPEARTPGIPGAIENPANRDFQRSNSGNRDNQRYDNNPQESDDPNFGNYQYSYDIRSEDTGDMKYHKESRDGNKVIGEYRVKEADGSMRIVKYTADAENGFQATVEFVMDDEEPKEFGAKMDPKPSRPSNQRNLGNRRVFEPARNNQRPSTRSRVRPQSSIQQEKDDMSLFFSPEDNRRQQRPSPSFSGIPRDPQQSRFDGSFQAQQDFQQDSQRFSNNFPDSVDSRAPVDNFQEQEYSRRGSLTEDSQGQFQDPSRRPSPFQRQFQNRNQFESQEQERFQQGNRNQFQANNREQFQNQNRNQFQNDERDQFQNQDRNQFQNQDRNQFQQQSRNPFLGNEREQYGQQERSRFQNQGIQSFQSQERNSFQNQFQGQEQNNFDDQERRPIQFQERPFQNQRRTNFRDAEQQKFQEQYSAGPDSQFQQRDQYDFEDNRQFQNQDGNQRIREFNIERRQRPQSQLRADSRTQFGNQFQNQIENQPIDQQRDQFEIQRNDFQDSNRNQFSSKRRQPFPSQRQGPFQNQNRNPGPSNRFQYQEEQGSRFNNQQQSQNSRQRYGVDSQSNQFQGQGVYDEMEDTRYQDQRYGQNLADIPRGPSNFNQVDQNQREFSRPAGNFGPQRQIPNTNQGAFDNAPVSADFQGPLGNYQGNEQFSDSLSDQRLNSPQGQFSAGLPENQALQGQFGPSGPLRGQSNNFQEDPQFRNENFSQNPQGQNPNPQFGNQGQRPHPRFEIVAEPHPQA